MTDREIEQQAKRGMARDNRVAFWILVFAAIVGLIAVASLYWHSPK